MTRVRTMDISSSLAAHASRKQLRRFAAELGLHADDPSSLAELVRLDVATIREAIHATIAGADRQAGLASYLEGLVADGLPPALLEQAQADEAMAAEQHEALKAKPAAAAAARAAAAPRHCCVECHARTPLVFELPGCRLCESCESLRVRGRLPRLLALAAAVGRQRFSSK
eukprot:SAG22_NODE_3643_length_1597_cov_4.369826_2_plen_171_part_00